MRRFFCACLILLSELAIVQAGESNGRVDSIEILETGIYEAREVARIPDDPTGSPFTRITDVQLVHRTTTIPAKIGLRFGLRYRPIGEPLGAISKLGLVVNAPGLQNPVATVYRTIGDIHHFGFTFEKTTELLPGIWRFEIRDAKDDRKIIEQQFNVVR